MMLAVLVIAVFSVVQSLFGIGMTLTGIGCSAAIVTVLVRVVPTLERADTLQAGEVLVTRFTDPGWTPVLGLVAGIVTKDTTDA